jgi:serine/threonine protein phosphatase PrpC
LACDGIWDCVSNEECTAWFSSALKEFDSNTFTYVPKSKDEKKEKDIETETNSTFDTSSSGSYIDNLKNLTTILDDEEEKKEEVKEMTLNCVVEKFLDSIVADDTSTGKGTDNMTCILVRFKNNQINV